MQEVLCENHFFESRLFGLSELRLALLGCSRPLPGQSWGPDGTQKTLKATPKLDQKWLQKGIQFWAALGPILGSVLGPKTGAPGGHIFQVCRYFRVHFLERRLLRKPCFLQGKTKVLGFILGPKTDPSGDPFFQAF